MEKLNELKQRLATISDLTAASSVLIWDQSTYMPLGGAAARGRQLSTLARLAHEHATDPALGRLLDDLQSYAESLPYDDDDASLLRIARREFERATRVPAGLVAAFSEHSARSYSAWTIARPANDFAAVRPHLEQTLELSRQLADCFPGYDHIADPLIDLNDYGMRAASVRALFAELRQELVPLVRAITAQPSADDSCLLQHYPAPAQIAFAEQVIRDYGYDFERGRQDIAPHPFMIRFALDDIRITTRVKVDDLSEALFSTLHESGHAMYEQGIAATHEATPLASGTSAGVHESQSRLWENQIGRSQVFWQHYYPQLQEVFPQQLGAVSLESFYRAVNKVQPSLIRTDADEVTYNLHVMIRFDLELALLEGTLAVADLPEAWRARYTSDLGVTPPDDRDGVLQDVHWFSGMIGGVFQGYTIGNLLSAQFFAAAQQALPQIGVEIASGRFATLRGWLREHIYCHGSKYTAAELITRATGGPLTIAPYMAYLREKYGKLYAL
ncbi:carboxypeptidase M32 [Candidatus Gracilibacteria bacterium]|nr:carboxypeptidase M32 [Candidatus Gracilibacteria bacterium]